MYKDADKRLTGNDVFEGYAIDLIKDVADILSEFLAVQKVFDINLNKFCKNVSFSTQPEKLQLYE